MRGSESAFHFGTLAVVMATLALAVGCGPAFQSKTAGAVSQSSGFCKAKSFGASHLPRVDIDLSFLHQKGRLSQAPDADKLTELSTKAAEEVLMRAGTPFIAMVRRDCVPIAGTLSSTVTAFSDSGLPVEAHRLVLTEDLSVSELSKTLEADHCIASINEDREVKYSLGAVNDPRALSQDHLRALSFEKSRAKYFNPAAALGENIVIAIIDSGVNGEHPDLSANMWENDRNEYGYDYVDNDGLPDDETFGHGTHVAGLAAAQTNNSLGTAGIMSSNVKIMSVRVLTERGGDVSNLVNGINYAIQNKANVINLSLGGGAPDPVLRRALLNAVNAGIVVVAAAGNENKAITSTNFVVPSAYAKDISGMISVGSFDSRTSRFSVFSNYSSSYVEIGAPGAEDSTSQPMIGLMSTFLESYERLPGTSMAAPLVSGAAALVMALLKSRGKPYTASDIEILIKTGSVALPSLAGKVQASRGLNLDVLADRTLSYLASSAGLPAAQFCP